MRTSSIISNVIRGCRWNHTNTTKTPSVEFYHIPESPLSRAVEMVAKIAGVTLNKHYVNLFNADQRKEEYLKLNPRHKVPFIIDGDLQMGESRAIMAYLVGSYMPPDNTLYPADLKVRAKVDELLYYDAGTLFPAAQRLLHPMLVGPVENLDADAEKFFRHNAAIFDRLIARDRDNKYYFGDNLTIADISLSVTLSFIDGCGYDMSKYKFTMAYFEYLRNSIPNYAEINNEAEESFKKVVARIQAGDKS